MKQSSILLASLVAAISLTAIAGRPVQAVPAGYSIAPLLTNTVTFVQGVNDGDGANGTPPFGEGVENAVDGTTNKFLSFQDLGSGFAIQLVSPGAITGLQVFTANDVEARDPASYLVEGSNNSLTAGFVIVASDALALPVTRNIAGQAVNDATQANDTRVFSNLTVYSFYRVTFPTLKNAGGADAMQLGEVRLLSGGPVAVPEASTLPLLAATGLVGIGAVRLRRRK